MCKEYNEILSYLITLPRFADGGGLERMRALCAALGNPDKILAGRFLHVAGTNGKGSTCAYLDEILRCAGYKVGRFVSPYILDYRERITFDGQMISEEELILYGNKLRRAVTRLSFTPCAFEAVTAVALCYFASKECDFVVWETGMGGRMDATNVVKPLLVVISHIDYDHTEVLGDTLLAIAKEKAGIIKEGCPVILAPGQHKEAEGVILRTAMTKNAPLYCAHRGEIVKMTPASMTLSFCGKEYTLSMAGSYQADNAGSVYEAIDVMRHMGIAVDEAALSTGFCRTHFPARFEVLSENPLILLDGAHNYDGLKALKSALDAVLPGQKLHGICGMLRDKNPAEALSAIADAHVFSEIDCFTPTSPRAMTGEELASIFDVFGIKATAVLREEAVRNAKKQDLPTVCFGSLYGVAELRKLLLSLQ